MQDDESSDVERYNVNHEDRELDKSLSGNISAPSKQRLDIATLKKKNNLGQTISLERPVISRTKVEELLIYDDLYQKRGYEVIMSRYRNYEDDEGLFYLGEGGRELLRSVLSIYGVTGGYKGLKGARIENLLVMAHDNGLWDVVQRIKIERMLEMPCDIHLRFIKYMSDRKFFERRLKTTEKVKTPHELMQHYRSTGTLPEKVVLSDLGRSAARTFLRDYRQRETAQFDGVCRHQHIEFRSFRNWNNPTLLHMIHCIDGIQQFCHEWAVAIRNSEDRDGVPFDNAILDQIDAIRGRTGEHPKTWSDIGKTDVGQEDGTDIVTASWSEIGSEWSIVDDDI